MSVGNNLQAVSFDTDSLTLVLGHNMDMGGDGSRNGTGKTTIINALSYALYGEALTNIRRDNLINKTNGKGMITTVDFEIEGIEYRIERGRRPKVLRLLVNGQDALQGEQQGDSRETQKEIEKIIGFPHNMFKHLIALNTYTEPFLSMKNNDQRDMIEQLLGITELSEKAEVLKERQKEIRDNIREEELTINAIENSNKRIEQNIKEIESRSKAWDKNKENKIMEIGEAIVSLEEIDIDAELENHKLLSTLKEEKTKFQTITNDLDTAERSLNRSFEKLEELKNNLEDAKSGVCPACGQGTAHLETHEEYTVELGDKILAEQEYYDELKTKVETLTEQKESFDLPEEPKVHYSSLEDALQHKHNLETITAQLQEKALEENPYIEQIEGLQTTGIQEISFETMNELTHLQEHQEFLYKLLTSKDSFIRKKL